METFTFSSELRAEATQVWTHMVSMSGINFELAPIRMTYPPALNDLQVSEVPLNQVLFHSWVLLGGIIPLDRHSLRLTEFVPGEGFHEESTSWLERRWIHDRRLLPLAQGCRVTDQVSFEPRIGLLRPLLARVVFSTFMRRHRRLRQRFGSWTDSPVSDR